MFVRRGLALLALIAHGFSMTTLPAAVRAADGAEEIRVLKEEVETLRRRGAELQRRLEELERRLSGAGPATPAAAAAPAPQSALDAALEAARAAQPTPAQPPPATAPELIGHQVGSARLRLIDVSLDTLAAAGWSTASDAETEDLQGGAHDPRRRGFTLQQAELSFAGAVDPYLNGEAHIVYTPGGVELEEAFMTTQALPYGLQLQAGHFFTNFGLINPLHPHAWDWLDQPIVNSRLFGGDGLRAPGLRAGWLTPLPWFSELHLGAQNANEGETTASFLGEDEVGGRPRVKTATGNAGDLLYLARWNNAWNLTDEWTLLQGLSGLHGPNSSGEDGETWIYGADLKLRWRPHDNFRGWPFFLWQAEASKRDYHADRFVAGTAVEDDPDDGGHGHGGGLVEEADEQEQEEDLAAEILRDYGFYTQALYGFRHGWAAGLRYEYATGRHASVGGRDEDPLRDDRHRLSPLLVWQPTEYSRFRLQYNYDDADHLDGGDAHSAWVGGEVLYGAHPAHEY